ncbi:release factor glutamine methyltransferase [Bacteroidia bacterium]|nr:release factor glutamine methyltransferase [Bacteroidia bacterium]
MQEIINFIKTQLQDLYPASEIKSFTYLIMESVCRFDKQSILSGKDKQLSANERMRIQEIVVELKNYRPIQYILGETEFYSLKFQVNENVLIPRPETEELVDWIVSTYKLSGAHKMRCLDIGTGSGCIAVALAKKLPNASVFALDISEKALEVARKNAANNEVKISFFQQDILKDSLENLPGKWDVIVSNPPYITPSEKKDMSKNVLDYEPDEALFTPQENPLFFYERIAEIGLKRLEENGALYFEINELYGKKNVEMLQSKGYGAVCLKKDIAGKDRMINAKL